MPRALSTSDGTPPPAMATRVLPPRAAKKRPIESSSDVEDVPKPAKRTTAVKKTAAKKGTAKKDVVKDVKGKGKAAEPAKKPNKGKQKVEVVGDTADEEPKAKRRKTTKAAPVSKATTTRAAKRASPDEETAPVASTSNTTGVPGTPPRKRQRLMEEHPVRRSPRRPNGAVAEISHAPEPTRESPRGRGQRLGQRLRDRAPELAPLVLPLALTPSPEPEVRETTPHEATPPASPRESSRPPSLGTLGLSQYENPIIPRAELERGSTTPDAETRTPSPAPTEIVHHFQPAKERSLDEINRELAAAGIKVRDFAWEGVYFAEWEIKAEATRQKRLRERERLEAKTEEWDREEVQASQQPPRQIGPPPSQNQQAGPSTQQQPVVQPAPSRALGRARTLTRISSAATFPPQSQAATQPAPQPQAQALSPSRPPNSQPAPGRRALVRQSRPLGRTGTVANYHESPGAGLSNAVAGPSNTARAMTPVREDTPVAEDEAQRASTPVVETSNVTPVATPQTTPTAAATMTAPSRPGTPSPAATQTRARRGRGSNEGSTRRVSGELSSMGRTPSSLSLVSVL